MEKKTLIFTDGASRGNPGRGGWGAVVVFEYGGISGAWVKELGGREDRTTNNKMEIMGAIEALSYVQSEEEKKNWPITLHTDSSYLINGITKWVHGWKKKGWITSTKEPVSNQDLWEALLEASSGLKIDWKYVGGHAGIVGNERCDEIATGFADGKPPALYDSTLGGYGRDIVNISHNPETATAKSGSKSRSKAKAYSYLSLLNGKVERHRTWTECEARVKGKPAKFKKSISAEDEAAILKGWGV